MSSDLLPNLSKPDDQFRPEVHQPCYVYRQLHPPPPSGPRHHTSTNREASRPSKRRRNSSEEPAAPPSKFGHSHELFVPLLDGAEKDDFVRLRYETYRKLWGEQEIRINNLLQDSNATTLGQVAAFVDGVSRDRATPPVLKLVDQIPTGLILTGPSIASHGLFFRQLTRRIRVDSRDPIVVLNSTRASNAKTLLRLVVADATRRITVRPEDDEDSPTPNGSEDRKWLKYDLKILEDYVRLHEISSVVVAFQDSEAFDGGVLSELILLFNSWLGRIPFVLLFGIATSTDIFCEKLPTSAIRCLQGENFDVERTEDTLDRVMADALRPSSILRPGPILTRMFSDRQADHVQSVHAFICTLKYLYMAHFYANPLSILMANEPSTLTLQRDHYEAIRNLPSFRRLVERSLDAGQIEIAQSLLDDDAFLMSSVLDHLSELRPAIAGLSNAVEIVHAASKLGLGGAAASTTDIYIKAVSGDLLGSTLLRDLFLMMKKMTSDKMERLLHSISTTVPPGCPLGTALLPLMKELGSLFAGHDTTREPLRTALDTGQDTLRTTVVTQKVALSKRKSSLSTQESTYLDLVEKVVDALQVYFVATLVDPRDRFLHELFFYDLKSPHRDVFTPRPRLAVERALTRPHDYLGCTCCATSGDALLSTQPATALLYQLYLESGALVNVFDLWSAFQAVIYKDHDDVGAAEDVSQALFYRALADLKHLGMIKHSRKKTDHLSKLAWKGL